MGGMTKPKQKSAEHISKKPTKKGSNSIEVQQKRQSEFARRTREIIDMQHLITEYVMYTLYLSDEQKEACKATLNVSELYEKHALLKEACNHVSKQVPSSHDKTTELMLKELATQIRNVKKFITSTTIVNGKQVLSNKEVIIQILLDDPKAFKLPKELYFTISKDIRDGKQKVRDEKVLQSYLK